MCNGASPVAGPPIQLPLGQVLTQSKPNAQPPIGKLNDNAEKAGTAAADVPAQTTPTRGNNLNIRA